MAAFKDLTGLRFGRLSVLHRTRSLNKRVLWLCRCDCGVEKEVVGGNLNSGWTKSCGCLTSELHIARITTHGMTGTPLFGVWKGMRRRCNDVGNKSFKNYGGRGIRVCDRWSDFSNFHADMVDGYEQGLTIERRDNDKDYEPGNCLWVPKKDQSKNRRLGELWDLKSTPTASNKSGVRGVSWSTRDNKWAAAISINGKQKNLGRFETIEAARAAYLSARSKREIECRRFHSHRDHIPQGA